MNLQNLEIQRQRYDGNVYFPAFIPTRSIGNALMSASLMSTASAEEPCHSEQAHQGWLHLHVHDFGGDRYCDFVCGHISVDQILVGKSPLKKRKGKERKEIINPTPLYAA